MTRVWVDYNGLDELDRVFTLNRFADGPVEEWDRVMTYDGEGNECPGVVTSLWIGEGFYVRIDREAFRPAT